MGIKIPNNGEGGEKCFRLHFPGERAVCRMVSAVVFPSGRFFENIRLLIFVNFTTIIRNGSINYNNVGILFGIYFILVIFVSNLNIFVYEKTHIF